MKSQFDVRRPWPLFAVFVLHIAFFFALQAALAHRSIEKPVAREVIAMVIPPETPKPQLTIVPPRPLPATRPIFQPPAPEPVIVPLVNTAPNDSAIMVAAAERPPTPAPYVPAPPEPTPVTPPRFDAAYLNNPAPPYPSLARRMGQQGKVLLRVHVNAEGRAEDVQLRTSSGFPRLDEVALDTVKQWRFVPARQGGQAVAAWVLVPLVFKLEG